MAESMSVKGAGARMIKQQKAACYKNRQLLWLNIWLCVNRSVLHSPPRKSSS